VKVNYPKWLFHATEKSVCVPDVETHQRDYSEAKGWYESPDEAKAAAARPPATTNPAVAAPATTPGAVGEAAPTEDETATSTHIDEAAARELEQKQEIWKASVQAIVSRLTGSSKETLEKIRAYETERQPPRKSLLEAIDAALAAAAAPPATTE
jgi:hypothetical protein